MVLLVPNMVCGVIKNIEFLTLELPSTVEELTSVSPSDCVFDDDWQLYDVITNKLKFVYKDYIIMTK